MNRYHFDTSIQNTKLIDLLGSDDAELEEEDEEHRHPLVPFGAVNSSLMVNNGLQRVIEIPLTHRNCRYAYRNVPVVEVRDRVCLPLLGKTVTSRNALKPIIGWKVRKVIEGCRTAVKVGPWSFKSAPLTGELVPG